MSLAGGNRLGQQLDATDERLWGRTSTRETRRSCWLIPAREPAGAGSSAGRGRSDGGQGEFGQRGPAAPAGGRFPAVVLLDVQMPEMDEFRRTAALIRARPRSQHTPIVFLTAINKSHAHVSLGYSLRREMDYILDRSSRRYRIQGRRVRRTVQEAQELRTEIARRQQAEWNVRELNEGLEPESPSERRTGRGKPQVGDRDRGASPGGGGARSPAGVGTAGAGGRRDCAAAGRPSSARRARCWRVRSTGQTTLEQVARLVVPDLADFCVVDLIGTGG